MWAIVPAILIALATYEAGLRHQRPALETEARRHRVPDLSDGVWIAHTHNALRTTLRFGGVFARSSSASPPSSTRPAVHRELSGVGLIHDEVDDSSTASNDQRAAPRRTIGAPKSGVGGSGRA